MTTNYTTFRKLVPGDRIKYQSAFSMIPGTVIRHEGPSKTNPNIIRVIVTGEGLNAGHTEITLHVKARARVELVSRANV